MTEMTVTPRQWDVLHELLKDGADNETIARRLGIARDTVKSHVQQMLVGADVRNRTALVVLVIGGSLTVRVQSGVPGNPL